MLKLDYFLYMAEKEGLVDIVSTKESRINAAINAFIKMAEYGYDINYYAEEILEKYDLNSLSDEEYDYIKHKVEETL